MVKKVGRSLNIASSRSDIENNTLIRSMDRVIYAVVVLAPPKSRVAEEIICLVLDSYNLSQLYGVSDFQINCNQA